MRSLQFAMAQGVAGAGPLRVGGCVPDSYRLT